MNWDDLRYYIAVARTKSLSEAARLLRVSPSTVSRRIDEFEQSLGNELFKRKQNGYDLNEAGTTLLPFAEQAEAHMLWLERSASQSDENIAGTVRLAVPELLGQYMVIPGLEGFLKENPELKIEIITDVRSTRLTKGDADILIRLNRPSQGGYTIQKIGVIPQHLYASKDYLKDAGTPKVSDDLVSHRLIGWDTELSYLPLAQYLEDRHGDPQVYFRTGSFHSQLMAVRSNLGIAALPQFVAEMFNLQKVLEQDSGLESEIWLMKRSDSRRFKRVNAIADAIIKIVSNRLSDLE